MNSWWLELGEFVVLHFPHLLGFQLLVISFCFIALWPRWEQGLIGFGSAPELSHSSDIALKDIEQFFDVSGDDFQPESYFGRNLQLALEEAKRGEI